MSGCPRNSSTDEAFEQLRGLRRGRREVNETGAAMIERLVGETYDLSRWGRRIAAALAIASFAGAIGAAPAALARRAPAPPTWRMLGPVGLGVGPHFFKRDTAVGTPWFSSGSTPILSAGAKGLLAAWVGPGGEVRAASGSVSGTWQSTTSPSAGSPVQETPEIVAALDPQGDALISWWSHGIEPYEPSSVKAGVASRAAAGAGWGPPTFLAGATANRFPTRAPAVAFDPHGDGFVVWTESEGGAVMASFMPAGTHEWQAPTVISPTLGGYRRPVIAVDGVGDATAVWEYNGPAGVQLAASTRAVGHGWSVPVSLGRAGPASIVAVPGRKAVAVWRASSEREEEKVALVYAIGDLATGRWSAVRPLAEHTGLSDGGITVSARGERMAWWLTASANDAQVSLDARTDRPGRSWGRPATIATWRPAAVPSVPGDPTCAGSAEPTVAFDAREEAIATWEEGCGKTFAARLPAHGARWSRPGSLGSVIRKPVAPLFSLSPNGDLIAVWLEGATREPASAERGEGLTTSVSAAVLQQRRR
jgi:hypothetical protein